MESREQLVGVASTTLLFGIALIYLAIGTLEFGALARVLRAGTDTVIRARSRVPDQPGRLGATD